VGKRSFFYEQKQIVFKQKLTNLYTDMSKVMLDRDSFKALASDTRLDILRALDSKKLSLKDICGITNLNKATLHVHLSKLLEAGFIKKKERDGHKWVYYKLTWKGESLLHPENTRIVIMFSVTFFTLFCGIIQLINFARGKVVGIASTPVGDTTTQIFVTEDASHSLFSQITNFRQVAEIPVQNQTLVQLSYELNNNADLRGIVGNTFSDSEIQWKAVQTTSNMVFDNSDVTSNAPAVVAMVQDPALMYIAIVCFIIFTIILCFSLSRLWKNRIPKL